MGYSCAAKASFVFQAITDLINEPFSNSFPNNTGFYERGKEQPDGAITGSVFKTVKRYSWEEKVAKAKEMSANVEVKPEWIGDPCVRAGSFKISASGKIERFPMLPQAIKKAAEAAGAAKYAAIYGVDRTVTMNNWANV